MKWIIPCVAALASIVVSLLLVGAVSYLFHLDLDANGYGALALGVSLTAGLSAGLMALIYVSRRSGYDSDVYHAPPDGGAKE